MRYLITLTLLAAVGAAQDVTLHSSAVIATASHGTGPGGIMVDVTVLSAPMGTTDVRGIAYAEIAGPNGSSQRLPLGEARGRRPLEEDEPGSAGANGAPGRVRLTIPIELHVWLEAIRLGGTPVRVSVQVEAFRIQGRRITSLGGTLVSSQARS